jgi:hypothetical protein
VCGERGKGGDGTKMYTHVSKCEKDNIKGEKITFSTV